MVRYMSLDQRLAARVALGGMIADLLNQKTASTYTPLNKLLDQLIEIPSPEAKSDGTKTAAPPSQ